MNNIKVLEEVLGLLQTLHETIGVPEGESLIDKNVLGGEDATKKDRVKTVLRSDEEKRVASISKIFAETFLKVQRKYTPDEKPDTLIKQMNRQNQKIAPPALNDKPLGFKLSMLMGGIALLLGGVWLAFKGMFGDSDMMGALKILSKIGIKGGIKIVVTAIKLLAKTFLSSISQPFKILAQVFPNIAKSVKSIFSNAAGGVVTKVTKMFSGKGLFKMLSTALKTIMPFLRKIPIIGSILSIGFAISRFKKGDNVGGVIDVLSALAGLLYLGGPVGAAVAFPLILGLDVLNMVLDAKAADPKNAGRGKMDILKDMAVSVGKFIWKNAKHIPILGSIKRFVESYDLFKSGNIADGLYQFGAGVLSLGIGPAITGFEMLMGMSSSKEGEKLPGGGGAAMLKNVAKSVGKFIWKNAEWIPVLGGIKRFANAYTAFSGGNIRDGLYQIGTGLLSFVGAAPLVTGIEMLMGMTGSKEEMGDLKPNKSWFSKLKDWIKSKLQNLPYVIRKPLEWFGILDGDGDIKIEGDGKNEAYEKLKKTANGFWGGFTDKLEEVKGIAGKATKGLIDNAKKGYGKVKGIAGKATKGLIDNAKKGYDTVDAALDKFTKSTFDQTKRSAKLLFEIAKKGYGKAKDVVKNKDGDKERRLKASGWDTWDEYKAAGWKYKKKAENKDGIINKAVNDVVKNTKNKDGITNKAAKDVVKNTKNKDGKATKGLIDNAKKGYDTVDAALDKFTKSTFDQTKRSAKLLFEIAKKGYDKAKDVVKNKDGDKERRLKASGWDTWEEYKAADWKYKKKTETPVVNAPIVTEKRNITDTLVKIGLAQHEMLKNIYNVNFQTLKSINKLGGGANVTHVTNMPTPSSGGSTPRVSMPDNRSGFIGSPYALA